MEDAEISSKVTRIENDSSIEISKNSRGWTFSVKAYGRDDEAISQKLENLLDTAKKLIKQEEDKTSS